MPRLIALLSLFICLCAPPAQAGTDIPFCPGEKLTYRLSWEAIPAGQASIEVMPYTKVNQQQARHFRMTANTNSFADVFYKVRDQVDSYTNTEMTKSLHYVQKQREGSYKRDITVRFFWDRGRAQYSNIINGPKKPIIILPGTFDPLSIFYAFRLMDIHEGASVTRPVTDGVKCVIGGAQVVGRETITVPAGTFDTFLVQPDLQHVGGVFKKSKKAKLQIWVTADKRLIPVRISSKVVVGRFFADLLETRIPEDCPQEPTDIF
ncbi:DUF3108 domain-containing protein [Desulfovibrio ferrophilus]|uniref:DUF3108 domain-containing protein n=1 Tax=Desulfovibrio ferrophilus TaxID=241368 RepID=A0A2Z6AUF0_9BACT|nr:DUF3108 domain-containing protein [Desulfovibrio ferrophilus]BBD06861.1 uncharacterized protein DFE_0135 [Desulfovibrio ferrophilus]